MNTIKGTQGSITLEACMVVPIFIIIMLLANGFFLMFTGQQVMAHALLQSSKSLAFDPYASQRVADDEQDKLAGMFVDIFTFGHGNYISTEQWYKEESEDLEEVIKTRFTAYLRSSEESASDLLEIVGVKNGLDGLDFSGSTVEDGFLTIKLKYTQDFVFNAAGLASFEREIDVKIKLFNYVQ